MAFSWFTHQYQRSCPLQFRMLQNKTMYSRIIYLPLLLTSLLIGYSNAGFMGTSTEELSNPVQLFDLYPEDNPNSTVLVHLTSNESSVVLPITVCFWLWPAYFNTTAIPVTLTSPNLKFRIGLLEGKIKVVVNDTCHILSKNVDAYQWYHMCTVIGSKSSYLFVNGEKHEANFVNGTQCTTHIPIENFLSVQIGYNDPYEFTGQVAKLDVFTRQLTNSEIADMGHCEVGVTDSSLNFSVKPEGGKIAMIDMGEMCKGPPKEFLALFEQFATQEESRSFCEILGGRLITQTDDISQLKHEITSINDMMTDSFMFWTGEIGEENGGTVINVVRPKSVQKIPYSRSAVLPVVGCMVDFGKPIQAKHDYAELLYCFPFKGKLIFQSKNGYVILFGKYEKEPSLRGEFKGKLVVYTKLSMMENPLGRKTWICPYTKHEQNITLTRCTTGHYTCSDGQCINLHKRCDGIADCRDESDEGATCSFIKLPSSYMKDMCPGESPAVDVRVKIDSVQEIVMEKNTLSVILSLASTWRDGRVTFLNLHNESNLISLAEANSLWYPKFHFENAQYKDNLIMRKNSNTDFVLKYSVKSASSGQEKILRSFEVQEYNGSTVDITREIEYLFTFECNYNYTLYPFDTQECFMKIVMVKSPGCVPVLKTNDSVSLEYKGGKLSMYTTTRAHYCYAVMSTGEYIIVIHLLLYRNFGSQLLTIFIPCIVLCVLAMFTLTHFQLSSFTDRITVTLSLLLVLASLFSQVSSTLPESPEPKLVDIFFSYCIIRVSFVFVIHCFIEKCNSGEKSKLKEASLDEDPIVDIYKKIAWLTQEPELSNKKEKKSEANIPRLINIAGIILITVADLCIALTFIYLALSDRAEKSQRLDNLMASS